jgi:hypothetical protein
MSMQITLDLPDEVYKRALRLAKLSNQDVADLLATMLQISLPSLGSSPEVIQPMSELSDRQVLALSNLQLDADQDQRLSQLLDRQQAGLIPDSERIELAALMQMYQEGSLRKAQALHEAVQRGLREPLACL